MKLKRSQVPGKMSKQVELCNQNSKLSCEAYLTIDINLKIKEMTI